MTTPTIITLLKADHREVSKLFEELDKTTSRSARKRQELFAEIDHALSVHADFEEARVYPLLEAEKASRPIALEAVEEHGQIKRLLAQLRDLDPQDDHWKAKATVLMEDVRHHVKEEEGDAFPKLRRNVTAEVLEALAAEYQAVKDGAQQDRQAAV